MDFVSRMCASDLDLQAMADLARRFPSEHLHVIDLPYRFSSWALDEHENTRLWFSTQGELLAWAVIQPPFWTFDLGLNPAQADQLLPLLLAWLDRRARQILDGPLGRPSWFVNLFARQSTHIRILDANDFVCQSDVGDDPWSKVWLACSAQPPIDSRPLPAGFSIHPLNGKTELADYVTLHRFVFQTKNMTEAWRSRILQHPAYQPDLDLVAVNPQGRLVGFCIAWLDLAVAEPVGQIEPMGVNEEYRRLGIGKALLAEAMRRLRARGARTIFVETDNYRGPALNLYETLGFCLRDEVLVYRKDYNPAG